MKLSWLLILSLYFQVYVSDSKEVSSDNAKTFVCDYLSNKLTGTQFGEYRDRNNNIIIKHCLR